MSSNITAEQRKTLFEISTRAKDRAHCPYSHFRVGACLLTHDATYVPGANIENASTPVGICAERAALATAVVSHGCKQGGIKAVGVTTDQVDEDGSGKGCCSPCGMCRQALREFCDLGVPVYMFDREGRVVVRTIGELLPLSFGPGSLPPPGGAPL